LRWELEDSPLDNGALPRLGQECEESGWTTACISLCYDLPALIIYLLGAIPSIVTIGQKRPVPTQQNNTKRSKKPRQIKKEDIKQEIPHVQLPVTDEEPIVINDSDEDDSIYIPKARTANVVVMSDTSGPKTSVSHRFCDTAVSLTPLTLVSGW